ALASGCTVVVKPSEYTPLTAVALFEVFEEAGFPPGVVNLVTTAPGSVFGDTVLASPKVRKVTFTGSTQVGQRLLQGSTAHMQRVSLELGGHAPFIVFDDADLALAVESCVASKFRNAGQTCVCANRIFVHQAVWDEFSEQLATRVRGLRLGHGINPDVDMGPLIHQRALERVQRHVDDAVARGAQVVTGGQPWRDAPYPGAFYEPTVLRGVTPDMLVCQEETFGPVAALVPFHSDGEVLELANGSPYGLAGYAFTRDLERALRVAEGLECGIVDVNDPLPAVAQAPFGGWKHSGVGVEGGRQGMDASLETKYISVAFTRAE
ncbi:MAG: aldehyde dehydrogenase family protein, partial [Alicyclobacillus sp.]|nr:aldehyde dehydrogenase family protein [Alicyclobacillus sp.]